MADEPPPPKRTLEPNFDRYWLAAGPKPASRSEMPPIDPDQLAAERAARRGLHPPPVTIRRVG